MRKTSSEEFDYDVFRIYELEKNQLKATTQKLPIQHILEQLYVPKKGK
jgi:hypothetical protein